VAKGSNMTDRHIIFSAPMVRALIDGRKTQTRRVLKPRGAAKNCGYSHLRLDVLDGALWWWDGVHECVGASQPYPYAPGDRLWVREAWSGLDAFRDMRPGDRDKCGSPSATQVWHWSDGNPPRGDWERPRPSIHMPRWASRLTLTVTDVRVQRLQQIRFTDTLAEGVEDTDFYAKRHRACLEQNVGCGSVSFDSFADLWSSIHGADAWDANPWVCALTFTVERRNIDEGAT
jgi:hypothetical protein